MAESNRKAKVTDEHREEAARLRAIWGDRRGQGAFGEAYGIGTQSAVSQFLQGESALSFNAAQGFAAGLKCSVADFSPRLAKEAQAIAAMVAPVGIASEEALGVPTIGGASKVDDLHAALYLLIHANERIEPITAAQVKPLFAMLFAGADKGGLDIGTIARRLTELLSAHPPQKTPPDDAVSDPILGTDITPKAEDGSSASIPEIKRKARRR